MHHLKGYLLPGLVILVLGGTCGTPQPAPAPAPTGEVEPNNELSASQVVDLSGNALRLTGTLAGEDLDLFNLGTMQAGDRVRVTIDGAGTDAEISVVVIEVQSDASLATLFQAASIAGAGNGGTVIDGIIRKAGRYDLGIDLSFATIVAGSNYDVTIQIDRAQGVPPASAQNFLLQFAGGSFTAPNGATVTIGPFVAEEIDPGYAGATQRVKDVVFAEVAANFAGYQLQVFSSDGAGPPAGQPFSTIFFGPVLTGADSLVSDGLGVAVSGVDVFNLDPSDNAVVFTSSFTPALFAVAALDANSLGLALGNVATHEAGHLLGLEHAFDPTDVMNTLDAPTSLLVDQRFKRSSLHFFVFDPLGTLLTQDGPGRIEQVCGLVRRGPNLTLTAGTNPFSIDAADFDLNGFPDLVVANQGDATFSIYLNNTDRTFTDQIIFDNGAPPLAIRVADINLDGLPDVISANPSTADLSVHLHNGAGLNLPFTVTAGEGARNIAVGLFNNDAFPDLGVPNFLANNASILLNSGTNGFNFGPILGTGETPQGIAAADLDGDGLTDLAVTEYGADTVQLFKGDGTGGFTALTLLSVANLPFGVAAADLNQDGMTDLAVTSSIHALALVQFGASVSVFLGQGGGQFTGPDIYSVEPGAETITGADFDGDGDVDLAVANAGDALVEGSTGNVSVLFNRGNGTFSQDVVLQAGTTPSEIVARDLDNNGKVDLAVANRGSGTVSIFFTE